MKIIQAADNPALRRSFANFIWDVSDELRSSWIQLGPAAMQQQLQQCLQNRDCWILLGYRHCFQFKPLLLALQEQPRLVAECLLWPIHLGVTASPTTVLAAILIRKDSLHRRRLVHLMSKIGTWTYPDTAKPDGSVILLGNISETILAQILTQILPSPPDTDPLE